MSDLLTAQTTTGILQNMQIYFPLLPGPALFPTETKSNSDLENVSLSLLTYFLIDSSKNESFQHKQPFQKDLKAKALNALLLFK